MFRPWLQKLFLPWWTSFGRHWGLDGDVSDGDDGGGDAFAFLFPVEMTSCGEATEKGK